MRYKSIELPYLLPMELEKLLILELFLWNFLIIVININIISIVARKVSIITLD